MLKKTEWVMRCIISENQALKVCCFGELCMLTNIQVSRNYGELEHHSSSRSQAVHGSFPALSRSLTARAWLSTVKENKFSGRRWIHSCLKGSGRCLYLLSSSQRSCQSYSKVFKAVKVCCFFFFFFFSEASC